MKQPIFSILTLLILTFYSSCKKSETDADNISTYKINEVLYGESVDTINELSTVFEIYKVGDSLRAKLCFPVPLMISDGGCTYLKDSKTGNIIALKSGEIISDKENWNDKIASSSFSLINFIGKSEMYIGTKGSVYLDGTMNIHYGWLKIYLSSNCDTLKIIDGATNLTNGNSINAGQKK